MSSQSAERNDAPEQPMPSRALVLRKRAEQLNAGLIRMAPQFEQALPPQITVKRFTRIALIAVQTNADLLEVDRQSLFNELLKLASQGLLPDGNEAALVVFRDKFKGRICKGMPMIAGVLKKIRQSGEVAKCSAQVVYANDDFEHSFGYEESVRHVPPPLGKPRGKPIGAYATAVLKDGSHELEVMDVDQIEKVRAVSRAKRDDSPWFVWWDEMARKTVMRRLAKRLPTSTDVEEVFRSDETMIGDEPRPIGIDSLADPALINDEAGTIADDAPASTRLDQLEQDIGGNAPPRDRATGNAAAIRAPNAGDAVAPSPEPATAPPESPPEPAAAPEVLPEPEAPDEAPAPADEPEPADFEEVDPDPDPEPDEPEEFEEIEEEPELAEPAIDEAAHSPKLAEALERVGRAELIVDVNAYVRAYAPNLSDAEADRLRRAGAAKIEEMKARRNR